MRHNAREEVSSRPLHRRGRPPKEDAEKKRAATFRLSPEAHELIAVLSHDMGLSQAGVLEIAVRDLACARGVRRRSGSA